MSAVTVCRSCKHTDVHNLGPGPDLMCQADSLQTGGRTCLCTSYDPMELDLDQPTVIRSWDDVTDEMLAVFAEAVPFKNNLGFLGRMLRDGRIGIVFPTKPPGPVWTMDGDPEGNWYAARDGTIMVVFNWRDPDAEAECRAYVEAKNAARLDDGD